MTQTPHVQLGVAADSPLVGLAGQEAVRVAEVDQADGGRVHLVQHHPAGGTAHPVRRWGARAEFAAGMSDGVPAPLALGRHVLRAGLAG